MIALDELDRRLVGALHLAPRASWDDLASVLGVDASTVGRRFARMYDAHALRVVGQVDWSLFSNTLPVHVFARTRGRAPHEVVERLGELPRVQYLARLSGRDSVYATVHAVDEAGTADLLDEVCTVPGIDAVTSLPVLSVAGRGSSWDPQLLTAEERELCARLGAPGTAEAAGTRRTEDLGDLERSVVRLLQQDGRASASGIGRSLGMATSTAHRLVRRLLLGGVVRPRVEIQPDYLGLTTPFVMRVRARPGATPAVLAALSELPESRFTTQVAGEVSVLCTGLAADRAALGRVVDDRLGGIPGVDAVEVDVVLLERRRYWIDRAADSGLGEFTPPPLL
jgi:DNA-binding Lrp family transcriptional regulator